MRKQVNRTPKKTKTRACAHHLRALDVCKCEAILPFVQYVMFLSIICSLYITVQPYTTKHMPVTIMP